LTGSPASLPGLATRVHSAIKEVLEPGAEVIVKVAKDPTLDAWKGMARFSGTEDFGKYAVTRAMYDEWGSERVTKWWGGNLA